VLIEDSLASSMASFNLTVALEEGAAFIFGTCRHRQWLS
jgi:hypothetical protein